MKYFLLLTLLLIVHPVHAQQVVSICYQVPASPVPHCVPVTSTNPLPVYLPTGH